ncbi:hypothetical protein [Mucilaginibacter ginkgonis]|uniref:Uncharacterized protein n=1 Tax=Mucilaginibacter ginkgonis TaxID=2682091 RepID=A0A6I4HZI4_9SPHI|nr:hypothetical protein [Mucilaginibacter ginkgonis]QQL48631.1 hypothetical protein GO620_010600 [Mucilaginibacter ginkgonis]
MASQAQTGQKAEIALNGRLPAIYKVDGTLLNDKATDYLKEKDIEVKKIVHTPFPQRDTVYITLKDRKLLTKILLATRLTVQQIAQQNVSGISKTSQIIFLLNDTLITQTAKLKISSLKVFNIKVLRATKTSYYTNFPDVTFLYIYTKPVPFYIR